jgi:hypothetical protein
MHPESDPNSKQYIFTERRAEGRDLQTVSKLYCTSTHTQATKSNPISKEEPRNINIKATTAGYTNSKSCKGLNQFLLEDIKTSLPTRMNMFLYTT